MSTDLLVPAQGSLGIIEQQLQSAIAEADQAIQAATTRKQRLQTALEVLKDVSLPSDQSTPPKTAKKKASPSTKARKPESAVEPAADKPAQSQPAKTAGSKPKATKPTASKERKSAAKATVSDTTRATPGATKRKATKSRAVQPDTPAVGASRYGLSYRSGFDANQSMPEALAQFLKSDPSRSFTVLEIIDGVYESSEALSNNVFRSQVGRTLSVNSSKLWKRTSTNPPSYQWVG